MTEFEKRIIDTIVFNPDDFEKFKNKNVITKKRINNFINFMIPFRKKGIYTETIKSLELLINLFTKNKNKSEKISIDIPKNLSFDKIIISNDFSNSRLSDLLS